MNRSGIRGLVLAALLAALARSATAQPAVTPMRLSPASPLDSFAMATGAAQYRFYGRIVRRDTTTTLAIRRTPLAAAVQVDSIFLVPRGVRGMRGRTITLILADSTGVPPGATFVFLASGVLFDTSIVLRERGRVTVDSLPVIPGIREQIRRADSLNHRRALQLRGAAADRVALGVVTMVSAPAARHRLHAEHDPAWLLARVKVLDQLKPAVVTPPLDSLPVYFSASRDWLFAAGPRLRAGDTVLVLLRPFTFVPTFLRAGLDSTGTYVVLTRGDVPSVSDLALAKQVIP